MYPDTHGAIFSGSAVVDQDNTSGFGARGQTPLVAIFAYHNHQLQHSGAINYESIGLAYSIDRGRHWVKYADNPALPNPGTKDFRDPSVSWYAPLKVWIMAVAVKDHLSFYSSKDLRHWIHESDFGQAWGEHAGVWECPNLMSMQLEGESTLRQVLLVSVNPGGPNGGSATQYFVGNFDGHQFTVDGERQQPASQTQWLDYGTDDYAGITWSNIPAADGRHLFLGWMNNWNYAEKTPTVHWRGAMTIPRELTLHRTSRGLELHAVPVREVDSLVETSSVSQPASGSKELKIAAPKGKAGGALDIKLAFKAPADASMVFTLANDSHEQLQLRFNAADHRYELDRSHSGVVDFSPGFGALQSAPIPAGSTPHALRILVDRSSVEIFINDGETVFTEQVFPHSAFDRLEVTSDRTITDLGSSIAALRATDQ